MTSNGVTAKAVMMDPIEPERIRGMSGDDDGAAGMLLFSPQSLLTAALLLLPALI